MGWSGRSLLARAAMRRAITSVDVGQGFSPETIDKLLKIIGNVIQQVDILQKSVGPAKEGVPTAAEPFTKL